MASATVRPQVRAATAAPPATFDDIARSKMRDTLAEYRGLVVKAASDNRLSSEELARVLDLLAYMGLPDFAWERDIKAQREHTANAACEAEAKAALPAAEARAAESTQRIKALELELKQLREQHWHDVNVLPRKIVSSGQRRNELAALNPHVFADIDEAARMRINDKNKGRPMPADPVGWST